MIIKNEGLNVTDDALKAITYVCEGDLRKAVNILQGAAMQKEQIDENIIYSISSRARPDEVVDMIKTAMQGNFLGARTLLDSLMINYGMSGEDVLLQMYKEVIKMDIDDKVKVKIVDKIGEYNFRLVEGANERIQLEALLSQFMLLSDE